jgi:hypothetical protein
VDAAGVEAAAGDVLVGGVLVGGTAGPEPPLQDPESLDGKTFCVKQAPFANNSPAMIGLALSMETVVTVYVLTIDFEVVWGSSDNGMAGSTTSGQRFFAFNYGIATIFSPATSPDINPIS